MEIDLDRTTNWPPRPPKRKRNLRPLRILVVTVASLLSITTAVWQCILWRSHDEQIPAPIIQQVGVVELPPSPTKPVVQAFPTRHPVEEMVSPPAPIWIATRPSAAAQMPTTSILGRRPGTLRPANPATANLLESLR